MRLSYEISITLTLILILIFIMVLSSKYAHGMDISIKERRPSITVDTYEASQEDDLKQLKDLLCDYAVKELMEKIHEEKDLKITQQRQKWIAVGIGTITTIIPLIIAIIEAFKNKECPSS